MSEEPMLEASDELLPCPFCGAAGLLEQASNHDGWSLTKRWAVVCSDDECFASPLVIVGKTETEAARRWNIRAGEPAARLREAAPPADDDMKLYNRREAAPAEEGLREMADWSNLPKDIYVVAAKSHGDIAFDVVCCSVPMITAPEVRYTRADLLPAPAEEVGALAERCWTINPWSSQIDGHGPAAAEKALREASATLSRLQARYDKAMTRLAEYANGWSDDRKRAEAAEQRVADLERITDRLDADLTTSDGHREAAESQLAEAALRVRVMRDALTKARGVVNTYEVEGGRVQELLAEVDAALAQPTEEASS